MIRKSMVIAAAIATFATSLSAEGLIPFPDVDPMNAPVVVTDTAGPPPITSVSVYGPIGVLGLLAVLSGSASATGTSGGN